MRQNNEIIPLRRAHGLDGDVELVTQDGISLGHISAAKAHTRPGALHRAFSIMLTDCNDRVCLQRRASSKEHWPGYLANTCCGHPRSQELLLTDAATRLEEELGLHSPALHEVGRFVYWAQDPESGAVEWEYDHVLIGVCQDHNSLKPNPREVEEVFWWTLDERAIGPFTPWLPLVLKTAVPFLSGLPNSP